MLKKDGTFDCCGGYGEHFVFCPVGQRQEALRRFEARVGHPSEDAYRRLLDSFDADDRARDAADAHRMERA